MKKINELSECVRLLARQLFVDNEVESDQYRESQPRSGLSHIISASHTIESYYKERGPGEEALRQNLEDTGKLMELAIEWVRTGPNDSPYIGTEECAPMLTFIFDIYWRSGFHPYYESDVQELAQNLRESVEGADNEAEIVAALADIPQ